MLLYQGQPTPVIRIGFTNVTASVTGNSSSDSGHASDPVSLTASGALVIINGAFAGVFSGAVNASTAGGGFSANATASVRVNATSGPVDESVTVAGVTYPISFSSTETYDTVNHKAFIDVSGSGTISFGNFIEVEGTINTGSGSHSTSGTVIVFLGQGPAFLDGGAINPAAHGVYVTLGSGTGYQIASDSNGYAFEATGTVQVVGVPGLTLSGTIDIKINHTGSAQFTDSIAVGTAIFQGTSLNIGFAGVSLTGAIGFEYLSGAQTPLLQVLFGSSVTSGSGALTLTLGTGANAATISIPSGTMTFSSAGVFGELTTSLTLGTPGMFSAGLAATLALNTTNATQLVNADTLTPGFFAVTATGASLTIGSQSLHGNFSFTQATIPVSPGAAPGTLPQKVVEIGVTNGQITLGSSGATVTASSVTGALLLSGGAVAGTLTAMVQTAGLGATLAGTFTLAVNTGAAAVNQQINVGSQSVSINVPAGPFFLVQGTGASLTVAGQTLSGNFAIQKSSGTQTSVTITVSDLAVSFGTGTTPVLTLSGGAGTLDFGSFNSNADTGLVGTLTASVSVSIPGVTLTGTLGFEINTAAHAVNTTFMVGTSTVTLNEPANYLAITGQTLSLSFLGQTVTGNFAFTRSVTAGVSTVTVSVSGAQITLAGLAPITISTGSLLITQGGIAGDLSLGTSGNLVLGPVTLSGTLVLAINTTSQPQLLSDSTTVPAGPYFGISGAATLTIANAVTLTGAFAIQQSTSSTGQTQVALAATGVSVSFGSTIGTVLTGGQGLFVILPSGIAGQLSGTVSLGSVIPGVTLGGTFGFAVNQTSVPVQESLSAGGQTVSLNLPAGPFSEITGTGVTLTVLGQTLTGDFSFTHSVNAGVSTDKLTAANVSFSLGSGTSTFVSVTQGHG